MGDDKLDVGVGHNFRSLETGDLRSAEFFTGVDGESHPFINY